jgi:hypothetical protein
MCPATWLRPQLLAYNAALAVVLLSPSCRGPWHFCSFPFGPLLSWEPPSTWIKGECIYPIAVELLLGHSRSPRPSCPLSRCGTSVSATGFDAVALTASSNYGNNMNCWLTINSPDGGTISVTFTSFVTEMDYDKLFIGGEAFQGRISNWFTRSHGTQCTSTTFLEPLPRNFVSHLLAPRTCSLIVHIVSQRVVFL